MATFCTNCGVQILAAEQSRHTRLTRFYWEAVKGEDDRPAQPEVPEWATAARLTALHADGSPSVCWLVQPGDPFTASGRGTCVYPSADGLVVVDEDEWADAYVMVVGQVRLREGDRFRIGDIEMVLEDDRVWVLSGDRAGDAFDIFGELTLGGDELQGRGVERRHCRLSVQGDGVYLQDLHSGSGTFVRARTGRTIPYGDLVLLNGKLVQAERLAS